jgi:hypothetical protein
MCRGNGRGGSEKDELEQQQDYSYSNRTTVSPPPWFDVARRFKALKPRAFQRIGGRSGALAAVIRCPRFRQGRLPPNSSGASGNARLGWGVAAMERWNGSSAVLGAKQRWVRLLRARRTSTRINPIRLSHPERHHTSRNPAPHLASARCLTRNPFAVATNG